jgi:hypothetical protein
VVESGTRLVGVHHTHFDHAASPDFAEPSTLIMQPKDDAMKKLISLILILSLAACSVCKSSDSPEVCRTKQRDHSQPHP